jgi:type II secretory pathway pseudopilin PulG
VLAVIGILTAIAVPKLLGSRLSANEASARSDVRDSAVEAMQRAGVGNPLQCPGSPAAIKSGYLRGCTTGVFRATPVQPGRTGIRGFGMDATGRLCFTTDGSVPAMSRNCDTVK